VYSLLCVWACMALAAMRRCLFRQTARLMTALVYVRRRYLLAVVDSTWAEKSREPAEISRRVIRSSLQASTIGNVQVMLLVDSSAAKAHARCLSNSDNSFRAFAPALQVSYGRAESRICIGAAGWYSPDHTEDPQSCCCTLPYPPCL